MIEENVYPPVIPLHSHKNNQQLYDNLWTECEKYQKKSALKRI
ncbi:hypothetical protein PROVRETT_06996 [Providencia rettgeri DSM 1131]|nr:hypothetical protein PROVRETT_06996 [Providencia rettgeri DSM 1131]